MTTCGPARSGRPPASWAVRTGSSARSCTATTAGKGLGYPTANLSADSLGLVPLEGVYAGWLTRLDLAEGEPDRTMPAAISVGTNPTFETHDRRTVEAYVLDRDDLDLYGERVMVEFTAHIRPTLKFDEHRRPARGDGQGRRALPRAAHQDRPRMNRMHAVSWLGPPA